MTGDVEVGVSLADPAAAPPRPEGGHPHRWAVLWVVLGGLFTTGFTITLLVVSLEGIAEELGTIRDGAHVGHHRADARLRCGRVRRSARPATSGGTSASSSAACSSPSVFAGLSAMAWNAASLDPVPHPVGHGRLGLRPVGDGLHQPHVRTDRAGEAAQLLELRHAPARPVIGVVSGAPLVDTIGWRAIFAIQAPLCLIGFVVALWLLPKTDRMEGVKFDVLGSVTLGIGARVAARCGQPGPVVGLDQRGHHRLRDRCRWWRSTRS